MKGFWKAVASAGPYTNNLHLALRQLTTSTPHHSVFIGRMLFLMPNRVKALKATGINTWY